MPQTTLVGLTELRWAFWVTAFLRTKKHLGKGNLHQWEVIFPVCNPTIAIPLYVGDMKSPPRLPFLNSLVIPSSHNPMVEAKTVKTCRYYCGRKKLFSNRSQCCFQLCKLLHQDSFLLWRDHCSQAYIRGQRVSCIKRTPISMTDVSCKPVACSRAIAEPQRLLKGLRVRPSLTHWSKWPQTPERSEGEGIYLRDLQLSHCGLVWFCFFFFIETALTCPLMQTWTSENKSQEGFWLLGTQDRPVYGYRSISG